MKLLDNRSLIRIHVLNILLVLSLFSMMWLLEGCTIELETEPIVIEVPAIEISLTESMDCDKHDLAQYLMYPICEEYKRSDCCNLRWSTTCMISFCDGCIGLEQACLEDSDEEER